MIVRQGNRYQLISRDGSKVLGNHDTKQSAIKQELAIEYSKARKALSEKTAEVEYRGQTFSGYNKPKEAPPGDIHKMVVLAKKGDQVKIVRFGHRDYGHNYSKDAKSNYLQRSAGIRDKNGNLTKDDPFSANYWARRVLWPQNKKADGKANLGANK